MNAKKVFVVTQGSYSDYHINGVFSSRENAEAYMGGYPSEFNEISEYELDMEPPRVLGVCWVVALRLDGSNYSPTLTGGIVEDVEDKYKDGERGDGSTTVQKSYAHSLPWFYGKSFVSREHALKLAIEQRQQALREHPEYFQHE